MGETAAAIDLFGEFELLKRLGAGAQAEVFLAATRDEQLVALKVMLEHLTVKPESRDAFKREARTSALLRHPNLVEVYDVGEHDGRPWISMELVRGWSLSALLKKLRQSGTRLDQDEAAELIRQAALGLNFAHEVKGYDGEPLGLVHRDVSPQNIMVSESGIAKVVDFGLAKATMQSDTVTQTIKGKLRYMPPEQLKSQKVDRRSDVFALGAVLWELACGTQLYPGQSEAEVFQQALYAPQPHPDEVAKGLTRSMVAVLLQTTAREADKRMASAKELAEALAPLSSPHARDKLGERIAKLFDRLPRTLEEARGHESSSPTLSGVPHVPPAAAPATPRAKKAGVLAPPPAKPSYVAGGGPVPGELPADFRERRTDQIEAIPDRGTPTNSAAAERPTSPAKAERLERPTMPAPAEKPGPPVPDETSQTNPGVSVSSSSLAPLIDGDTHANTAPGIRTVMTELEDEPTHGSMITAPSRRVVYIAIAASIGIVGFGALVGALLRGGDASEDEEQEPYAPARIDDPARPGQQLAGGAEVPEPVAPAVDGGPAAARVAHAKKPQGRTGRVEIDANIPAVVRERNVDLGVTPFSKSLSPGRHRLSVATPDGTASTEMDLVVKPGETVRRTVKLNPR